MKKLPFFYDRAIEKDPELLRAHYNLSLALVHQGRGVRAVELLKDLLERDTSNVSVLRMLGYSFYKQNQLEDALSVFDSILSLITDDTDAMYNRGLVFWKMDRIGEAEEVFLELLTRVPADGGDVYARVLFNLGKLNRERENPSRAAEFFERYIEWNENDPDAYKLLAACYIDIERYNRALETYDMLIELNEVLPEVWMSKAEILLTEVEDPVNGLEALNQALLLGFKDRPRIGALMESPKLISKKEVEEILTFWNLML